MSFPEWPSDVEDNINSSLLDSELAESVVYDGVIIKGIFDPQPVFIDAQTGLTHISTDPQLSLRLSDLPAPPMEWTAVNARNKDYLVGDVMKRGKDWVDLRLISGPVVPFTAAPFGNPLFLHWLNTGARAGTVISDVIGDLTSFTWEWCFKPSLAPSVSKIMWRRYVSELNPGDVRISRAADGKVVVIDPNHGEISLVSSTVWDAGVWHRISLAYDAGTGDVDLMIDGVVEDSGVKLTNPWSTHPQIQQPSGCALGEWADMRMWNYKRSPAEVLSDFSSPLVGDEPGLVAYWPGDGEGNTTNNAVLPGEANMTKIGGGDWDWRAPRANLLSVGEEWPTGSEEQLESMLIDSDLAESVFYLGSQIRAIFDPQPTITDPNSGVPYISSDPLLSVRLSDLAAPPMEGDAVVARGDSYFVGEIVKIGAGWSDLRLVRN